MTVVDSCATDESGKTKEFLLDAPPKSLSMASGAPALPYTLYNLRVSADGFLDNIHLNIPGVLGYYVGAEIGYAAECRCGRQDRPCYFQRVFIV